ncbi:MAG: uroporphyrinogen-III C-methyltransferase [Solirubrobacteraceae bacterium]
MPDEDGAGRVFLVGAGPGDPGLLTARALELIATAEVILYDRLVGPGALDGARPEAELLFVGKEGGGEAVPQERTEQLLVEHARAGRRVVRLKGGDPFVFGRGGEEALALRAAGIPFEVVPGITAGVAAPAYAGIPVTHRGLASAVALVTGHTREDGAAESGPPLDWPALAAFPGTLVFYMGVRALPQIAESLIAAGRPASEPAAVVEAGTLPRQRTVTGTLETIAAAVRREQVRAPSVTVVGAVAQLASQLSWLTPGPLAGRTVAVTRARAQASGLAARLAELGAHVIQAPAISVRTLSGPPLDPSPYDLICLTSPNGVERLFERLAASQPPRDARSLAGARIAAIGPGTARALAAHGIRADIVPERFVAESLVEALRGLAVTRALVARAAEARDVLPDALREQGAQVDVLPLYETVAEAPAPSVIEAALRADYLTFTSSSTVRFFLQALAGADSISPAARIVSIGPVTSQTLRENGLEPHIEAERHDIDGLLDALLADAGSARGGGTSHRTDKQSDP